MRAEEVFARRFSFEKRFDGGLVALHNKTRADLFPNILAVPIEIV
jgi:hypothetical protein